MGAINGETRRKRVERGIYRQSNGRYAVCVMVEGRPRFRTVETTTLAEVRKQRELLAVLARLGALPVSSRLTLAEVAARWLAEFEAKVALASGADGRSTSTARTFAAICYRSSVAGSLRRSRRTRSRS